MQSIDQLRARPHISAAKLTLTILALSLGTMGAACRRKVSHIIESGEPSPMAQVVTPEGEHIPEHIRVVQLVNGIEQHFPELKALIEQNLAVMDVQGQPHVSRDLLLAPFEWVENNRRNPYRNAAQLQHDRRNQTEVALGLDVRQFMYEVLAPQLRDSGVVYASYNPLSDIIGLPEAFDPTEVTDLCVFYHEVWHKIFSTNRMRSLGRAGYLSEVKARNQRLLQPPYDHALTCVPLEDEALAHFMTAELMNVILNGRLRSTRGRISLAEMAYVMGAEHPIRQGALATTRLYAPTMYAETDPMSVHGNSIHYPGDYLQMIINSHTSGNIVVYHIDANGNLQMQPANNYRPNP